MACEVVAACDGIEDQVLKTFGGGYMTNILALCV